MNWNGILNALRGAGNVLPGLASFIPVLGPALTALPRLIALADIGRKAIAAVNPELTDEQVIAHALEHCDREILDDEKLAAMLRVEIAAEAAAVEPKG